MLPPSTETFPAPPSSSTANEAITPLPSSDTNLLEEEDSSENTVETTVETFVVNIPRYRHGEQRCKDAKMEELNKFEMFDVYEEVSDQGQTRN